MKKMLLEVSLFCREDEGASAVEYGILVSLIAVAVIATVTVVGAKLEDMFNRICAKLGNGTC